MTEKPPTTGAPEILKPGAGSVQRMLDGELLLIGAIRRILKSSHEGCECNCLSCGYQNEIAAFALKCRPMTNDQKKSADDFFWSQFTTGDVSPPNSIG